MQKDLLLYLSRLDFDPNDPMHMRILQTIYRKLTRNAHALAYGSHWEDIGFQGVDPRTDLNRSGRVLNLVHMLFFHSKHPELFRAIYLLSRDVYHNFPFAITSVNFTKLAMEWLGAGTLSAWCRKAGDGMGGVLEPVAEVYVAAFFMFYDRWKKGKRMISDFDRTFKEVQRFGDRGPGKLLRFFKNGCEEHSRRNDAGRLEFTDLNFDGRDGQDARPGGNGGGGAGSGAGAGAGGGAARRPAAKRNVPRQLRNYTVED